MEYDEEGNLISSLYKPTSDLSPIEKKDYYEKNSSLIFDGEKGEIYAKKIKLGIGAEIETKITLGSATLWNPNANEKGMVLTAGELDEK